MNWSSFLVSAAVVGGFYMAAEAAGKSRGKQANVFKRVAVGLALVAGLALVVGAVQFDFVTSPPGWLAAMAAAALIFQLVVAARDLADGQPDRGCRIAMLMLPLLLVVGGAWLMTNVPRIVQQGGDHISTATTDR